MKGNASTNLEASHIFVCDSTDYSERMYKLVTGDPHTLANSHKGSQKLLNSEIIIPNIFLNSTQR